jgi:hypothetical protein
MIDLPAFYLKQRSDAPIAVPPILARQPDNIRPQGFLILPATGNMTLHRTAYIKHSAGTALRYAQLLLYLYDAIALSFGA